MEKSAPCSICEQIPASLRANTGRDENLPAPTHRLKQRKDHYSAFGTDTDLWECPECGTFYVYTTESAFTGSGNNDEDTLDKLSRAQSDVLHAMFACAGDPAKLEDELFALPPIALEEALGAAHRKDRDFMALFIPRLVLEYAKQGPSMYGSHPTREMLHDLIERKPTYAREVLATTQTLPPELYDRLGDLEKRCARALVDVT